MNATTRWPDPPLCRMMRPDMKPILKAIFPVAALSTRFLPATKAMPKEILPVVVQPLIPHDFHASLDACIEDFIFASPCVCSDDDRDHTSIRRSGSRRNEAQGS